jgi:hypothetical protein
MIEIMKEGLIEIQEDVMKMAEEYRQVVIPNDNEDLDLTHWWVIREEGAEMLYVGTPETFTSYVQERNGGIH